MIPSLSVQDAVDEVVSANAAKAIQAHLDGRKVGWFVGQVMKELAGAADRSVVEAAVRRRVAEVAAERKGNTSSE